MCEFYLTCSTVATLSHTQILFSFPTLFFLNESCLFCKGQKVNRFSQEIPVEVYVILGQRQRAGVCMNAFLLLKLSACRITVYIQIAHWFASYSPIDNSLSVL